MKKNFIYMFFTLSIRLFSNSIIFFFLAKLWGVKSFGFFMYPFTIVTLIALIIDYGFSLNIVKEISENPKKASIYISNAFYSKVILTIFSFVIFIPIAKYTFESVEQLFLGIILLTANVLNSYGILFNLPLRSLGKFNIESLISMYSNLIYTLILLVLIYMHSNPIVVSLGILLSRGIYLFFSYSVFVREVSPREKITLTKINDAISGIITNFPYAIHLIIGSLYFQIDTLLIHRFLGNHGVGLYQSAMRIILGVLIFVEVLNNIYLPKLSQNKETKQNFLLILFKMNKYSTFIGFLISIVIFFYSEELILNIYGKEYMTVVPILQALSILIFIRYSGATIGLLMTIVDKQKIRALAAIFAFLINMGLNFYLVPKFGLLGAAYAGISTALLLNLFYLINTYKVLQNALLNKSILMTYILWLIIITYGILQF